jgi:hypothetical protein
VRYLVALLALTGCLASDPDYSLPLNVNVINDDPELTAALLSASERIHRASGVGVYVEAPRVEGMRQAALMWGALSPAASGSYDPSGGTLTVDLASPAWAVPTVVLHELLHALGSGHCLGVLTGDWPGPDARLTLEALAELCATAPCRWMRPE